jgi:hypothetical protein
MSTLLRDYAHDLILETERKVLEANPNLEPEALSEDQVNDLLDDFVEIITIRLIGE